MSTPIPTADYVGKRVSFLRDGLRLVGVVEAQEYAGLTERGSIPDWKLTVRGASGACITISLVESYATVTD